MGHEELQRRNRDNIAAEVHEATLRQNMQSRNIVKCDIGEGCDIRPFTDLYGCKIGKNCKIDSFTYVEEGVVIGDECRIRTHVFIPTGTTIGNRVFIGSHVVITNDRYPKIGAATPDFEKTVIEDDVAIGVGAILLPGIRIGKGSLIGAGTTVVHDVPPNSVIFTRADNITKERRAREIELEDLKRRQSHEQ